MKLQDKLNKMKQDSMAGKPPEIVATMVSEVQKLVDSGIASNAINTGEPLPEFTLLDEQGNAVSSKELVSQGPLAISFYRGVW